MIKHTSSYSRKLRGFSNFRNEGVKNYTRLNFGGDSLLRGAAI